MAAVLAEDGKANDGTPPEPPIAAAHGSILAKASSPDRGPIVVGSVCGAGNGNGAMPVNIGNGGTANPVVGAGRGIGNASGVSGDDILMSTSASNRSNCASAPIPPCAIV